MHHLKILVTMIFHLYSHKETIKFLSKFYVWKVMNKLLTYQMSYVISEDMEDLFFKVIAINILVVIQT